MSDLTNQTLERKLSDQELSGLLVTTDLTESDSSYFKLGACLTRCVVAKLTWLVSVGLLDTSGRGGGLASSLGSKLLTGSLATSGLT